VALLDVERGGILDVVEQRIVNVTGFSA